MHAICALGRAQKIDEEDAGICGFAVALQNIFGLVKKVHDDQ